MKTVPSIDAPNKADPIDLSWHYPEREVLKSWTLRALDRDPRSDYLLVLFMTVIMSPGWLMFLFVGDIDLGMRALFIGFIALGIGGIFLVSRAHKKNFSYRCTAQGFEVIHWRNTERAKKALKITFVTVSLVVIGFCLIFPDAIMGALVGPPGLALVYWSMTRNESYWEWQKDESSTYAEWEGFNYIVLYPKYHFIILCTRESADEDIRTLEGFGQAFYMICPPERYNELAAFVSAMIPNAPCVQDRPPIRRYKLWC